MDIAASIARTDCPRGNLDNLLKILDLARWAPSGDNTQPWRFEIVANDHIVIHGHDTRDQILYDFDGHASHMAHGALLETMRIAASGLGWAMDWRVLENDSENRHPKYEVHFHSPSEVAPDPLLPFIEKRVVQRRPMRMKQLTKAQRDALVAAPGDGFILQLFESFPQRRAIAKLLWNNAYIRLTCPEAFPVHQSIIEWGTRFSKDRIPEEAVGVDPLTAKLMRWVMQSWGRVAFFNKYLMGTVAPRVQLDYLPALMCAAHLLIRPRTPPQRLEDWVQLGQAMQRVWLTATQQGLHLQPEMTPVIFRWYARAERAFSADASLAGRSLDLARNFEQIADSSKMDAFGFFGRVGVCSSPRSRSVRLGLDELMLVG